MDPAPGDAPAPASAHDSADHFEQKGFRLRFGWGPSGLRRLAPAADVVVIVDVLSFSTAVDIAVGRGAVVLPYRGHADGEEEFGRANRATVAARHPAPGALSLRPSSLVEIAAGTRLVLPSPNGSALAFAAAEAGASHVVVGSLRNAGSVGRAVADKSPGVVTVIAAGERWRGHTGPLRPAVEDLLGAGAILSAVDEAAGGAGDAGAGGPSPEARVAIAGFAEARADLADRLSTCGSGRELIARGFAADVDLAAALDASSAVPVLRGVELVNGWGAR